MSFYRRLGLEVERTVYAIAGLPIALRGASLGDCPAARQIHHAFAVRYWHPATLAEALELVLGLLLAPVAVPVAALWFTARNGPTIRKSEGKSLASQLLEELRLYLSAGIVGPWYYILSLHRDGRRRAPTFLQRCETKRGIYALLKSEDQSRLGDKQAFAQRCLARGVRCIPCELVIGDSGADPAALPDVDLFVKPLTGEGGKGAERWDRIAVRRWTNGELTLEDQSLCGQLRSKGRPLIVQKRVWPHPELEALTSGALPTVRAVTVLDEQGRPELVAAVFRMSVGENRTVDNIHAGGLACAVSLRDGRLGPASNLGADARLGWHSRHPTTGARIEGTRLPFWNKVKALATAAHSAFPDRVMVGWDIAITADGPIVVEGNRGPDMDLMQRFMEFGFCRHRFGELIAHHLQARGFGVEPISAPGANPPKAARDATGTSAT